MAIKDQVIEVDGTTWHVREAASRGHALSAIAFARVTGSVGSKETRDGTLCGGQVVVLADVVQLNSDGTERKPDTQVY